MSLEIANKVSVIIPTYNRSHTLLATINSALSQTYQVMEILVCDDGSSDNSKELVTAISDSDSRVKWIEGTRGGRPAIPRNNGIRASSGNWLAFLDSDDCWANNKIETQLEIADRLNCKAVCSNAYRIKPSGSDRELYFEISGDKFQFKDLIKVNNVICSSALVHRSVIDLIGYFPESVEYKAIEDYAYWLKVATYTDWGYSEKGLVEYFDDPKNSVRAEDVKPEVQKLNILSEYLKWNNGKQENESLLANNELNNISKNRYGEIIMKLVKKIFS